MPKSICDLTKVRLFKNVVSMRQVFGCVNSRDFSGRLLQLCEITAYWLLEGAVEEKPAQDGPGVEGTAVAGEDFRRFPAQYSLDTFI